MPFNSEEKVALLAVKGVGPTVISRLEQIGIDSMDKLSHYQCDEVITTIATLLNASCWKNSPQAKKAINDAINLAKQWDI